MTHVPGAWVQRPPEETGAPVRMFCFAHAGGGRSFFAPWRAALLPDIELCPVVLPGRETRIKERPLTRVEDVIDRMCEVLPEHLDRPFALFGHSMGSVLAYETARALHAAGLGTPLGLIVSGRRAPHLPARRPPLHLLAEDEFVAAVARLGGTPQNILREPGLLRLFLPTLRADFELNETYRPLPGAALPCPVSAFVGAADPEAAPEELAGWRESTAHGFSLRVFRGDHFYLKGTPGELFAALRADIRRFGATVPVSHPVHIERITP
ncbi:thioesterase II family protein [Streptomyces canus]|uniref:Surfactin synthase thioesterase subunit n=1 Tax=Streptomyces canus TaxID=58343 RepID=A0AAW8FS88_9ACTN|nr:alpha/beta fold hydrolase [Streptomyces canus]MDQ0912438.1 surfactin synthase thioesterase subunit [Streptomyces canus]MDQ1072425.1 surfactin synthase thioesterase subunit [Streptomyces canus]